MLIVNDTSANQVRSILSSSALRKAAGHVIPLSIETNLQTIINFGLKAIVSLFCIIILYPASGQKSFTRVEDEAGLGQITSNNGVAVADYNKDGYLDIFIVGIRSFDSSNGATWNRLLKNNGNGTFEDVTVKAGFDKQFVNTGVKAARGEKMGASWGDYDNDGYPDLLLTNSRGNQLYHNQKDGTFKDVTVQAGVKGCDDCYGSSALWFDYDRDGDLDLYVSSINGYNTMYENMGSGVFKDVTRELGVAGGNITWTSVPLDVNNDGWLDLYLVNDTYRNQLFLNKDGKYFEEVTGLYGLDDQGPGMGVTIGDYNNDGRFDIYVTNIFNLLPNPLYTGLAEGNYRNDAKRLGVENTGWGWGVHFFDFDNDGDEDIYAVNGVEENQYIFNEPQVDTKNVFFKNLSMEGGTGFVDWSAESGTDQLTRGRGLEAFDYDNDGDLDLIVGNNFEKPFLFRNETINGNQPASASWIKIWLEGTTSNRDAIGTKIKATINGKSYYRWYQGAGFLGQSLQPVHFGFGSGLVIDEIQISWPNGLVEKISNIPVNQTLHLKEGNYTPVTVPVDTARAALSSISAYPNPFYNSTTFKCTLAEAGSLDIRIINSLGYEVFRQRQTGNRGEVLKILWDGTGKNGNYLSDGMYYYIANFGKRHSKGKILKLTRN